MTRWLSPLLVALFLAGAPTPVAAQGFGGQPSDRLGYPGTPTDRYLEPDEVRGVLHAATEAFYSCFRAHVRGGEGVGQTAVSFTVGRDGRATAIRPELDRAPQELGPCIEQIIGELDFGAHDGDPLEVSYPLVYQVDRKGARILPYPIVFTRPRPVRLPLLQLPPDVTGGEIRMLERILVLDEPAPESAPTDAGDSAPSEASAPVPDEEPSP